MDWELKRKKKNLKQQTNKQNPNTPNKQKNKNHKKKNNQKKLNKWSIFQDFRRSCWVVFESVKYICFLKLVITADCHH